MNRGPYIQELMEGMHMMQKKMLAQYKSTKDIDNVTFSQWRVLDVIDEQDYVTIKDIHIALNISSSAATQLVNELEKKNHVVRKAHPDDKRASAVALSGKTRTFINRFKEHNEKGLVMLFEPLNDREFEQFIMLHKKIIKNISENK